MTERKFSDINEAKEFLEGQGFKVLNESQLSEYLMRRVYNVAEEIYAREIDENVPDLDASNQPSREYLSRFDYLSAWRLRTSCPAQTLCRTRFPAGCPPPSIRSGYAGLSPGRRRSAR